MDTTFFDGAFGAMLGQVIGDTIGAQVEFKSARWIADNYPEGVREVTGGGPHGIIPGQVTDDSELALALARSLAEHGVYEVEEVARAYVQWRCSGPFDIGGTTSNALSIRATDPVGPSRLIAPAIMANAKRMEHSQANGSLMRIAPLGVFYAGKRTDYGTILREARLDSSLTHASPVCQMACASFVMAIKLLVEGMVPAEAHKTALAVALGTVDGVGCQAVVEALDNAQIDIPENADGGKQGWVLIALQNAFYQLLHAQTFEEALVETINLGGDTDTNGAIAGALCGAWFGAEAIPERWRTAVLTHEPTRRPTIYHTHDLKELTQKLLAGGAAEAYE